MRPIPRRARLCGASVVMSAPSRAIRPALARFRPVIRLNSEVLPAPFGPITREELALADREVDAGQIAEPPTARTDRQGEHVGRGAVGCAAGASPSGPRRRG